MASFLRQLLAWNFRACERAFERIECARVILRGELGAQFFHRSRQQFHGPAFVEERVGVGLIRRLQGLARLGIERVPFDDPLPAAALLRLVAIPVVGEEVLQRAEQVGAEFSFRRIRRRWDSASAGRQRTPASDPARRAPSIRDGARRRRADTSSRGTARQARRANAWCLRRAALRREHDAPSCGVKLTRAGCDGVVHDTACIMAGIWPTRKM